MNTKTPSGAKINQVNVFQKNGIDLRQANKQPYWEMAVDCLPSWEYLSSDKVKALRTKAVSLDPVINDLRSQWSKLFNSELKGTTTENDMWILFHKYENLKKETESQSHKEQAKDEQKYAEETPGHKAYGVSGLTDNLIEMITTKNNGKVYINRTSFYQAVATLVRNGDIVHKAGGWYQTVY